MEKYDFINGERIECFPIPTIKKKQDGYFYEFKNGESFNFENGSKVDTTTIYYKYPKNFMILDYNRLEPIAHVILNGKVYDTLSFRVISEELFNSIDEFIDIKGTHLNISEIVEINQIHNENVNSKEQINNILKPSREKFKHLTQILNTMKDFDKVIGTSDVLNFINEDNFKKVRSSLPNIYISKKNSIDEFIENVKALNNSRVYYKLSQAIDEYLYDLYKETSKAHRESLRAGQEHTKHIYNNFNLKWKTSNNDELFKKLGCYLECLNEMYWNDKYNILDIINLKNEIRSFIDAHNHVAEDYLEWLDICDSDKEDIINLINEINFDTNNTYEIDN